MALTHIGAGKEIEDALESFGIKHLDQIWLPNDNDLMIAKMRLPQATSLRHIALYILKERLKKSMG